MPCNCDYMEATGLEKKISEVVCLLEEIQTGKPVNINSSHWQGYHPKVYNQHLSKDNCDFLVADLCSKIQKSKKPITRYSLEMQLWWREHQQADKDRKIKEKAQIKENRVMSKLLEKLNADEIKLLEKNGLKVK